MLCSVPKRQDGNIATPFIVRSTAASIGEGKIKSGYRVQRATRLMPCPKPNMSVWQSTTTIQPASGRLQRTL
jgi:hypothetical protein